MRLSVISLMTGFPWGGSEELWLSLARYAAQKGDTVDVLTMKWDAPPAQWQHLKHSQINHYPFSRTKPLLLWHHKLLSKAGISVDRRPPDHLDFRLQTVINTSPDLILFSQGGTFDFLSHPVAMDTLLQTSIPFAIICHFTPESGLSLSPHQLARSRKVFLTAKKVFFVSKRNLLHTEALLGHSLPHAEVVNNPVNLNEKKVIPLQEQESQLSMACVARIDFPYKGQHFLVKILSEDRWKSRNFSLTFFGKGPDQGYLRDLIAASPNQSKIHFGGHVSDIAEIWKNHQLLVMPSSGEGTPLALVEAMLCGRPALVTDVGGNTELIREGFTGFVAPAANIPALESALERAWEQRDSLALFGKNAFLTASTRYQGDAGAILYSKIFSLIA